MTAIIILLVVIVLLVGLILSDVPVALALLASGAIGLLLLRDADYAFNTLANQPFNISASFAMTLIPMFIIMGMLVVQAGIARDVYAFAARVFGRFPGGLGYATIAACAGFAAVTGSSGASVATIGKISVGEMRRHGYNPAFAAAIVAAAGTLGILIPPSVVLVIYGTLSGESIGALLMAGIIPGILSALMYAVVVWWRSGREMDKERWGDPEQDQGLRTMSQGTDSPQPTNPGKGLATISDAYTVTMEQPGRRLSEEHQEVPLGRQYTALFKVGLIFVVVVGGIYSGIFTATESGAIAAVATLIVFLYSAARRPEVKLWKSLGVALQETTAVSSMIFLLLIGGGMFAFFLASGGYARDFATWTASLDLPAPLIVIAFLIILIPLGMFLDGLSILLITVPLMHPVVLELGFDGVWFAILVVKMIELGLITPPVGINVYIVSGVTPGLSIEKVFRAVWPFGLIELVTVSILFAFPWLVTWLPSLIR